MNKIHGDAVDGRKKKRKYATRRRSAGTTTGTPDPMKLTGQSGLFIQCMSFWSTLKWYAYYDSSSASPIPHQQFTLTFFNDPFADPNLIMLMSLESSYQAIQRKFKKPCIELLKIRIHPSNTLRTENSLGGLGNLAVREREYYFFDGPGAYETVGKYAYRFCSGVPNNAQYRGLPMFQQRPELLLVAKFRTMTGKDHGSVASIAYAGQAWEEQTTMTQDFTDGAGHGMILVNTFISFVTVGLLTADGNTTEDMASSDNWIQIYYRIHYEDLLEETIKDMQSKSTNFPFGIAKEDAVSTTRSKIYEKRVRISPPVESSTSESSSPSSEEGRMRKIKKRHKSFYKPSHKDEPKR